MPRADSKIPLGGTTLAVLCTGALLLSGGAAGAPPADAPPARDALPGAAREVLRPWMQEHRTDTQRLLSAVLQLQYRETEALASALARGGHLARPAPRGDDTVNSAIPPRFFQLQDELASAARTLATSARNRDNASLAISFGGLMQTCVNCHAVYASPGS